MVCSNWSSAGNREASCLSARWSGDAESKLPAGLVLLRASNTDPTAAGQHAVLLLYPFLTR